MRGPDMLRFLSVPATLAMVILCGPRFVTAAESSATQNGCQELAAAADQIVEDYPAIETRAFIRELARRVAGIDPGPKGIIDLAQGGENVVVGGGFKPIFDDGSQGQARHFAGTAGSVERFGAAATLMAGSTFLRDPPDSADGRLGRAAVVFATKLIEGDLTPLDTSTWIREYLCEQDD